MQWLIEILHFLSHGWMGSIIGIVGVIAAVITYFLTRRRTRFAYCYVGGRLLGLSEDGLPADITVQYQGQEISRLTRTLVVFWNAGEKTISIDDIAKSDLLRLQLRSDGRILAATILKKSRDVCQVQVRYDPLNPKEAAISFEFLDARDGAVVEILHTSEMRHMNFLGTIRGLPNGFRNLGHLGRKVTRQLRARPSTWRKRFRWVMIVVGIMVIGLGIFMPPQIIESPIKAEAWIDRLIIISGGASYILLGFISLYASRRRYPKALHIDELD